MATNTTIVPALPEWYACDIQFAEDGSPECVGIHYEPVIAWAITSHQNDDDDNPDIGTIPVFAVGGPHFALDFTLYVDGCDNLFYKQPNGKFRRSYGDYCDTEQQVMDAYSDLIKKARISRD